MTAIMNGLMALEYEQLILTRPGVRVTGPTRPGEEILESELTVSISACLLSYELKK